MRLVKDKAGFVSLYDQVEKKVVRVRGRTAVEILSHPQQSSEEGPRFITMEQKQDVDRASAITEEAKRLLGEGVAPNRYSETENRGLTSPATGSPQDEVIVAPKKGAKGSAKDPEKD